MIKIDSVSKYFDSKIAIDNVSFELKPGEIFGLLGPNGAGKTTLIRMLLDILKPDEGQIIIDSHKMRPEDKNNIGYLPEERGLYKNQKVFETLAYLAMLKGLSQDEANSNAEYYLSQLDLLDYKDKKLSALSKGMQQKVQFIATIIAEPNLIILDEPFSGLDPLNARVMKELIKELKRKDRIIVLSTHQMNQVEEMCDNVLIINKGKKIINGDVKSIREKYSKNEYLLKPCIDYAKMDIIDKEIGIIDGKSHIVLKNGYSQNDLLKGLLEESIPIEHFEKRLVPLEDIFIYLVSKDDNI
ncbi:MAG: ATP-binding cassette domain-containing protein [Cyanobacteriota bacterium]